VLHPVDEGLVVQLGRSLDVLHRLLCSELVCVLSEVNIATRCALLLSPVRELRDVVAQDLATKRLLVLNLEDGIPCLGCGLGLPLALALLVDVVVCPCVDGAIG
jgi:hypothetical protein